MNRYQLEHYLRAHLRTEIRYLLSAATEWHAQKILELKEPGYEVQVYAMDSAFVHARSLFEFFTEKTTDFHYSCDEVERNLLQGIPFVGCGFQFGNCPGRQRTRSWERCRVRVSYVYGLKVLNRDAYTKHWKPVLHSHLMHAQHRTAGQQLPSFQDELGTKRLKRHAVDFAREVVRLWRISRKSYVNNTIPNCRHSGESQMRL
jgi:hypothetical protein